MYYIYNTSTATKLSKDASQLRQCCCAASSKIVKRMHSKFSIKLKQTQSILYMLTNLNRLRVYGIHL